MALDPYSPCPCGSSKKFKWCCQPIYEEINKAFAQERDGQHENALRIMEEVTRQHPDNPEAWGRRAELLYGNGRVEEAENSLQKALELNPNYPFGLLLLGMFRQNEGELPGALILYRKAADAYDPEARDYLAVVYGHIGDCELKLNRPVAARAAFDAALHNQPGDEQLRQINDQLFGAQSRLPAAARKAYTLQSPATTVPARRQAWDQALANSRRLSAAAESFTQLTADDAEDAAAWYNLGLIRAWLGDNHRALEALDRYVALETDETRAADAWAMAEVLRQGQGMDEESDYLEYGAICQLRDPQAFFNSLQQFETERRLIGVHVDQEQGVVTGVILDRTGPVLAAGLTGSEAPGLGAYMMVVSNHVRLWNTNAEALGRVVDAWRQQLGPALSEPRHEQTTANFSDVLADAMSFPLQALDEEDARRRVRAHIERYFEEKWIHRPLRALNRIPPIDAAGHGTLRKKLLGIIQFIEDCAAVTQAQVYDFNRLRRKLGLTAEAPPAAAASDAAAAPDAAAAVDPSAMSAAELAALKPEDLSDDVLEQASQAALKLDARDLVARFAEALVARPPRQERPDRFPWYAQLVQRALRDGDTGAALDYLNAGEKADCEHNEGRRRNDYELRRGEIHARRGDAEEAQGIFDRLIERVPGELRYRGTAAEAMLSARQGKRALHFAEDGLAKARAANDRDSEQYFMELVEAAKKQAGS